ncbi:pyruvate dehydrogenase E2 component (dihydrolipoamide acetyltransferase) [Alkalibacillus filiformis]|uniref:Dihydrolipoamide acetyltransferase component of pyruvate dehydrogenase complex n=1 Tax=Alkalibacillus filiformis TaxID=200990 RepID=A0ABU0DSH0_9BACI|nr:dihydrolipoamide acetyltransferase family protein [Alkalibacillus filiformis]MDQ0351396.1 pyruvate dehydrogenase E2 component (dihydrolipoamide acetyltransferase) [Alkalibacillus filiformis]
MLEVKLHDIGEGMTEGEIVNYFVKEGDSVSTDQPLVEVQTDKMVAELPSPGKGTVKEIVVPVGETVQVGTTLLYIEGVGAKQPEQSEPELVKATSETKGLQNRRIQTKVNRVLATPYTRKIARDHNVDIEQVTASDPSGRVTEEDVYQFINGTTTDSEPKQTEPTKPVTLELNAINQTEQETIPFRGIRKTIANKMTQSIYTIPHVTHFDEMNMTRLFQIREQLKQTGDNISIPAFLLKALVITLKDFPVFNAQLDEENEQIILKKQYHIGLASDTKDGLIVPVLHDVDRKSLRQIHSDMKAITEKAQNGNLEPQLLKGSTFTMSNVGPLGSTGATPIINYPETALIAFHKTRKLPIYNEQDEIVPGYMMNVSMSFDHRVADGATAVAFTNRLNELIENPNKLMLELV